MQAIPFKSAVFGFLACLLIGILGGYFFGKGDQNSGSIEIKSGNNSVSLDLKKKDTKLEDLLHKLFKENKDTRIFSTAWLKSNDSLYHYKDRDLADKIEILTVEEKLSQELVELSDDQKGPWYLESKKLSIGYPAKYNRTKGKGACCRNSDYKNKWVEITGNNGERLEIELSGQYPCASDNDNTLDKPQIQINQQDAITLFGKLQYSRIEADVLIIPGPTASRGEGNKFEEKAADR